jgi:hypothetical protein
MDEEQVKLQHTLLGTDDAMVWAEEFCRIFDGKTVSSEETPLTTVDPGLMVGWFANAMQTAVAAEDRRRIHAAGGKTEVEEFLHTWHMEHPEDDVVDEDEDERIVLEDQFIEGFYDGRNDHIDPYGDTP